MLHLQPTPIRIATMDSLSVLLQILLACLLGGLLSLAAAALLPAVSTPAAVSLRSCSRQSCGSRSVPQT